MRKLSGDWHWCPLHIELTGGNSGRRHLFLGIGAARWTLPLFEASNPHRGHVLLCFRSAQVRRPHRIT